jgi:hypothetical protein
MNKQSFLIGILCGALCLAVQAAQDLESRFENPPRESRTAVFWFWSNSVSRESITRDLTAMQEAGIGRAVLSMTRYHSGTVPLEQGGTVFLSPAFLRDLRFALDEAERLGLQITLNPANGWYQGGPWVTPDLGSQMLVWSVLDVTGPESLEKALPLPDRHRSNARAKIMPGAMEFLQPVAVLAYRKSARGRLVADSLVRLDDRMDASGRLTWDIPPGDWAVYRFGHIPNMIGMHQDSPGYTGLQIDHLSQAAIEAYCDHVIRPLLDAAGPHVGGTLDRLHEDSLELGFYDWTAELPARFKALKAYDPVPRLPELAGAEFEPSGVSPSFPDDFAAVLEDLLVTQHYGSLHRFCRKHGLSLGTEGGDVNGSIRVKGAEVEVPMGEFWTHRTRAADSFNAFNRNTVFASHLYGLTNSFEAFTSLQHWMETPAELKAMANEVYALGADHLTVHGFSMSRPEIPAPGDVYFAGTHFNPGVTWWDPFAKELVSFFNRSQALLTAGTPVVDLLYLDGPFIRQQLKTNEMLHESELWKFDVIDPSLIQTLSVSEEGAVVLPGGQTCRVLVLTEPFHHADILPALTELVKQGATVWIRTDESSRLIKSPAVKDWVGRLGAGPEPGLYSAGRGRILIQPPTGTPEPFGDGPYKRRYFRGDSAAAMRTLQIPPAFSYAGESSMRLLFTHRQLGAQQIFFVANAGHETVQADCTFRAAGMQPERWDPVTGKRTPLPVFKCSENTTTVPLQFEAHESFFVVFKDQVDDGPVDELVLDGRPAGALCNQSVREKADGAIHLAAFAGGNYQIRHADGTEETRDLKIPLPVTVSSAWDIRFIPAREEISAFQISTNRLFLWNQSPDARLRGFSGTAVYTASVDLDVDWLNASDGAVIDLGPVPGIPELRAVGGGNYEPTANIYDALCAEIRINRKPVGLLWSAPWRLDCSGLLKPGTNEIEIRVINPWHNWRVANGFLPVAHSWSTPGLKLPLIDSGLSGPVRLIPAVHIPFRRM